MKMDQTGVSSDLNKERREKNSQVATEQTLERDSIHSPQEIRTILKSRANALAQEPQMEDGTQEFMDIIAFRLAAETYGLEAAFVREIVPLKALTPLPGVPPFVLGIVNVRGQILSVIDLKKFFGLPVNGLGQLNKLIILQNAGMEFGILADEILVARALAVDDIQTAPPTVTGIGAEYMRGVTAGGVTAEGVIILDAEKILNDEKIIVHQEAE